MPLDSPRRDSSAAVTAFNVETIMTTRVFPRFLRVMAVGVVALLVFAAAITRHQVHPPNNASAPIVIAVIADNYAAGQHQEFLYDVENFFQHGLLVDDYFKNHQAELQIVTFFEPAASATSNYGFSVGMPTGNCAVGWQPDTLSKLEAVINPPSVANNNLNPRHIVVIGNHPYNFGCTHGRWTYVAVDAVGTDVLQHEFGHVLAGLFDEWSLTSNGATPYPEMIPPTDTRNCFDQRNPPPPHWNGLAGSGSLPGCDLYYTGVVHAFENCRMGASHHTHFCEVCKRNMDRAFQYELNPDRDNPDVTNPDIRNPDVQNPDRARRDDRRDGPRLMAAAFALQPPPKIAPKPLGPRPILRLVVSFDPNTLAVSVKKGYFTTAPYVPQYRRLGGQFVYEFMDGNNAVLEVGVLPGHLFEGRSYRGAAQQHQTAPPAPTDVVLLLPEMTIARAKDPSQPVILNIYRLGPNVAAQMITPNVLRDLKDSKLAERVGGATAEQIRAAF
jgi:hypothetical protein